MFSSSGGLSISHIVIKIAYEDVFLYHEIWLYAKKNE